MKPLRLSQAPLFAALAFFFCCLTVAAQAAPSFPKLTGRVVDEAGILSPQTEMALDAKLADLEAKTTRQLVVVTIPSLQGYEIADYGYQLGRTWQIGQKGENNGALFIVAPNDRKVRIEVGYGLEPVLTDALSSVIMQQAVLPKFRSGDMEGGVVAGTDALIAQLTLPDDQAKAKVAEAAAPKAEKFNPFALIPLLIILFVVFGVFRRGGGWWLLPLIFSGGGGGRGGWGDGGGGGGWGGGGGGFSGGGGSFGGGGSSGSW